MKSQAELPVVGLIISFTIIAGILAVPVMFRLTTAQQLDSTYKFENAQHALLALSYSTTDNGQSSYEHIGSSYMLKTSVNTNLKKDFEKVVTKDYCISIKPSEKNQVILLSKQSTPSSLVAYQYPLNKISKNIIITDCFGSTSPIYINGVNVRTKPHTGIDLNGDEGDPVYASTEGKVKVCLENQKGCDSLAGNYIVIQHPDGYQDLYAHLSSILVKDGDNVATGKQIGKVGATGSSTGPHLHFEVDKNGKPVNPCSFIDCSVLDMSFIVKQTGKKCQLPTQQIATSGIQNACRSDAQFNALLVLPYNKQALVEVIGIGVT